MARWWAEFKEPEPAELAFYRDAIERFGEPALDLACGAGRLLSETPRYAFDLITDQREDLPPGVILSEGMHRFS